MFEELKPHLIELRKRLIICVVCLIAAFFICFNFWEIILDFLKAPVENSLKDGSKLVVIKATEGFFTAMKVSFFSGFLASIPVIFWQFWRFVEPGLYENEKKYVIPFVLAASVMFLCGAAFSYYMAAPVALHFLVTFGGDMFSAMLSIEEYVSFITKLIVAFGIAFELPVITFFLAKLGLVDDAMLKRHFRVAVLIIFIFAAIMTPPDVLSQFLMAIPLVGLYIISIYIVSMVNPAPKDEKDE